MKHWTTICAVLFLFASGLASPCLGEGTSPGSSTVEVSEKKSSEISLERKIAGYGVLAFLLIWLFTRGKKKDSSSDQEDEGK